jgi:predicted nucleotidyltransferase
MSGATRRQDPLLREIVERLLAEIRPCRIYLFGSRARGDSGAGSDDDLLLLVEQPTEPPYRIPQRAYRVLRGVPGAVDVLVWDRETFDSWLHLPASFPATVVGEGRLLYAA